MIGSDSSRRVDHRALATRLRALDRDLAAVEAALIEATMHGLRATVWTADGHRSIHAWLRATTRWADPHIARCVRMARLCLDAPQVLTWLHDGRVTVDRVDVLARAWSNPRVRTELVAAVDDFADHAAGMPHGDFELLVRTWVNLIDVDGGHRTAEQGHAARHLTLTDLDDGTMTFRGELTGPQAAQLRTVLDAYIHAEFLIDRDQAITEHGPDVATTQFARTHRQRALDALVHLALDAAAHAHCTHPHDHDAGPPAPPRSPRPAPAPAHDPTPQVIVHTDPTTITKLLQLLRPTDDQALALAGIGSLTLHQLNTELAAGMDPARLHAHTGDGRALPLADVLTALILGRLRLVIEDERGIITHAGRSRRLFTGAQRDLALAAATHCVYAGCTQPAHRCQADHLHPHSHGGPTDTDNAAPTCNHHNRWRHHHRYTITRDHHGHWHTWRPDGTEV